MYERLGARLLQQLHLVNHFILLLKKFSGGWLGPNWLNLSLNWTTRAIFYICVCTLLQISTRNRFYISNSHSIGKRQLGADYMSRAGSVSRDGSVYRDDCSARYYMRRASPRSDKFRSCRAKRWLHQREWIECFYFRLSIILVYNFQFHVAL